MTDYASTLLVTDAAASDVYEVRIWPFALGEPADVSAPTVALVAPSSLNGIGRSTPIKIELDDDRGIEYFVLLAIYPSLGRADLVYDGADPDLETGYTITPSVVSGRQRYEVLCRGGWPASGFLRVRAIDAGGNVA